MIIKDVQLTRSKQAVILSATCKIRKIGWDKVYFKVDAKHGKYICDDASPFAAALLIPSMKQGEDLIVKGSISQKLYDGMRQIMQEVLAWDIGLKPIAIKPEKLVADRHIPTRTATFFSGGVDSFYTYLKHKQDKVEQNRIDSFILINNSFDIDPRNQKLWDITLQNITAVAKTENIDLVVVESNINSHELLAPIVSWDYIHGGCLAATGLFLREAFRRIYIPSTFSEDQQLPWGSHMNVDKHWSTEKTAFVHDGTEATRLDKVVWQIAKSPLALRYLRVCYENTSGAYNCGNCDKCVRTMIHLYIAGALDKAKTFPHKIDLQRVAAGPHVGAGSGYIPLGEKHNLEGLRARNMDPELQAAIETSMEKITNRRSGFKNRLALAQTRLSQRAIYLDFAYAGGFTYSRLSKAFGKKFA